MPAKHPTGKKIMESVVSWERCDKLRFSSSLRIIFQPSKLLVFSRKVLITAPWKSQQISRVRSNVGQISKLRPRRDFPIFTIFPILYQRYLDTALASSRPLNFTPFNIEYRPPTINNPGLLTVTLILQYLDTYLKRKRWLEVVWM